MAQDRIQFVDSISPTATVRLSFSVKPWRVLNSGTSLPPPGLNRVTVSSLMDDGNIIPAAAYQNRTLTLHVQLRGSTPAETAAQLQLMNRELDRPTNVLRYQPDPSIAPVYFRTFRAPDYAFDVDHGLNLYDITLSILAEPFAYGEVETSDNIAIYNDPAAVSNGKYFEITGVKGDVETPIIITEGDGIAYHQTVFAVRRGGTPSNMPKHLQCESMTLGTNTTTQANNSAYSGTGNNSCVTTFAASNTLDVTRLSVTTFPSTASTDVRGTYRVFVRVNASATGSTFQLRLWHGQRGVYNDSTQFTQSNTTRPIMVDCGLVQLPEGFDPVALGPSNAALTVAGGNFALGAYRVSGTANLIWDYMLFVPADDRLCLIDWGTAFVDQYVADGYQKAVYGLNASDQVVDIGPASFAGDMPLVSPDVTNRIVYINDAAPVPAADDLVSWNADLTVAYYPRYLYVSPVVS